MIIKHMKKVIWILSLTLGISIFDMNQLNAQTKCQECNYWQSKVDIKVLSIKKNGSDLTDLKVLLKSNDSNDNSNLAFRNLTQDVVFVGIKCLLELRGKKYDSKLTGTTRADVSQQFGTTSVEVASLYFVSYLFFQKWDHADAPFLMNADKKLNTDESVLEAYRSYAKWFKKVKEIGLEEARKQKLDPLADSGVSWY